ncbi:MAG: prolipoprotein diacylglyceryl transferase [Desulfuromonadaceae bacterium]|nr:prolipoprotein diacylglyceryl transferase [Desulfuromonadaceae bacterium]
MLSYPHIDPVLIQIGPLSVRWYGLMYLLAFGIGYLVIRGLGRYRQLAMADETASDLLFYAMLGVILGGRLGYVLFYNPAYYLRHPLSIFAVWEGGMSFHGGLLGVTAAVLIFSWKKGLPVLLVADIMAGAAAPGLFFGRIGNFINGELWGRVTDLPWGMVFPGAGPLPRHPSQLYEAFLEGLALTVVILFLHRRKVSHGVPFFTFFLLYGMFRFLVEFVREPDAHLGYLWAGATMGQLLCLPMMALGIGGLVLVYKNKVAR